MTNTFILIVLVFSLFVVLAFGETHKTSDPLIDTPVKIKKNPRVSADGCQQESGLAKVRITFDKSGEVTEVVMTVRSGCEVFDNRVMAASKALEFEPATKDGEPISVTRLVEYRFDRNY